MRLVAEELGRECQKVIKASARSNKERCSAKLGSLANPRRVTTSSAISRERIRFISVWITESACKSSLVLH